MGGAEGIVHVDLAERGQLLCECGIIGFLFGVEAQVLQQQHLAILELVRQLAREIADAIRRKSHIHLLADSVIEHDAEPVHDRPQAVFGIWLALGAAEVRAEDDLAAVAEHELDGRQRLADAGIVEDFGAILRERHIEIDPDEHMLVLQLVGAVGEAANRGNLHGSSLAFCAIENGFDFDFDAP